MQQMPREQQLMGSYYHFHHYCHCYGNFYCYHYHYYRLVFSAKKTEHASPLLRELQWLKVPERIKFHLCVLTYRCLHGTAPSYLAETICPVSGLATWCHLRSADTSTLLVPTTCRSTLGDRAFPAAAARVRNSLPCHVRDMPSLFTFRRELKTVLFRLSYPVD